MQTVFLVLLVLLVPMCTVLLVLVRMEAVVVDG
jgi:hypothetical protein